MRRSGMHEAAAAHSHGGSIERVTFHNAENGFCVLLIKARGYRDLVTVSGVWVNDRQHGQQFKAAFLRSSPPTTAEGIEKYLGSGMIRGIGFRTAVAIADRLSIEPTAMIRLRAGVNYALHEASGEGHCGLPTADLLHLAADLLAVERPDETINSSREPLQLALIQTRPRFLAIGWVDQRLGVELAASKKEAVELALASKLLVINGGPGVGKTTLINAIHQGGQGFVIGFGVGACPCGRGDSEINRPRLLTICSHDPWQIGEKSIGATGFEPAT
jgi:ATP-dependent exoDNAse (exonuclease V) alpha subunit